MKRGRTRGDEDGRLEKEKKEEMQRKDLEWHTLCCERGRNEEEIKGEEVCRRDRREKDGVKRREMGIELKGGGREMEERREEGEFPR